MQQPAQLDLDLPRISDEMMQQGRAGTRASTVAILKKGAAYDPPHSDPIIWEHGRRNFALRAAGLLRIVCPIADGTDMAGIDIFDAEPSQVEQIMLGDPAVQAGVLTFEIHTARSFHGDALPASRDGAVRSGELTRSGVGEHATDWSRRQEVQVCTNARLTPAGIQSRQSHAETGDSSNDRPAACRYTPRAAEHDPSCADSADARF